MFSKLKRAALLAGMSALLVSGAACAAFFRPEVRPGYGVTKVGWLSDYHAPLKGTNLDTPVFYLEGKKPGATMLILGGTHPREIAGHTGALTFIENANVSEGRLIVIPALNASGYSVHDESTQVPRLLRVPCRSGYRYLPFGDRRVDPADQPNDPDQYKHQSGATIPNSKGHDGAEMRNINRNYPGLPDGTPTQQAAYAVMEIVRRENVVLSIDMHESDTPTWSYSRTTGKPYHGGRLAYMLVCNPKDEAMELGAEAVVDVTDRVGLDLKIEPSNPAFRGLSHLEIGNATPCLSFLFETPNPAQDSWREAPDPVDDPRFPLKHRVGLQCEVFCELVNLYNESHDAHLVIENVPDYKTLMSDGLGKWLN